MNRVLSVTLFTALIGFAACSSSALEPFSETRSTAQTRPGGASGEPAGDDPPLTPSPTTVPVAGTITEIPSRLGTAAFLIEEHPDQPLGSGAGPATAGEKYHVWVTEGTSIRIRTAMGESRPATLADIAVGARAEVWFVGPIRESYPAQGTAGRIMILGVLP